MSRFQLARFEINGRVAHIQVLQGVVKLTVAVSNRVPKLEAAAEWKTASTEVFGIAIEDPALREYASQSVTVGDLVMVAGRLASTQFSSGQATRPASGLKLLVTELVCVPKRQADRLDAIPPVSIDTAVQSTPPF